MPIEGQHELLRHFPTALATDIVSSHFADTSLFDLFIGEQWASMKSQLPYIVFDLETDGDTVREFAFRTAGHTHYYETGEQLSTLVNEINSKPIVVGHRIKEWDLKVLKDAHHDIRPAFAWDTLEMEILLNPCRHAYSLHTLHNAKDDTELTDRLFWNQLFRLSQDAGLCKQLSGFLPENIEDILEALRRPAFTKFLAKTGESEDTFYQDLRDMDASLIDKLKTIDESEEETLIIAPMRLWNRISQHVSMSFIREEFDIDYLRISADKIKEKPLDAPFLNIALLRFCQTARTPVVSNLSSYLRINYFNDETLLDYVVDDAETIQCADLRIIESLKENSGFKRIYFIGCELENRLNQYELPTHLSPAEFFQKGSSILMRFGGSGYVNVTSQERKSPLFAEVPRNAANVWMERNKKGEYIVGHLHNSVDKNVKLYLY